MSARAGRGDRQRRLRLEFFGGPSLWQGHQRIGLSPSQAGLLSVVFGTGRPITPRSQVQVLLWEEDDGKAVRHRLSQLIYQTNTRCRARVVTLEGEYARANTDVVATDLEEFGELVGASDLLMASDLVERGFLSAFPKRRTDALSDWIQKQAVGRRKLVFDRAAARWAAAVKSNDWSGARVAAEAVAMLVPRDEAILERALHSHAGGGAVHEAEAAYRLALKDGGSGGSGVTHLGATPPTDLSGAKAPASSRCPFLGRASELAQLKSAIRRKLPTHGRWQTVVVSGEAGIGKTRLVEEATVDARRRGYRVLRGSSGELERTVPLSPLLEGLNQPWVAQVVESADGRWRQRLRSLLPQLTSRTQSEPDAPAPPNADWLVHRRHTCDTFLHLFSTIAASSPIVLVLDNLHAIDEASATVVEFMQRRWHRGEITLILCHRPEELPGNDAAARLLATTGAMQGATAIRLRALPEAAAAELASHFGESGLGRRGRALAAELAGGNPLLLIELAREIAERGHQRAEEVELPARVRSMVSRRLSALGRGNRRLLDAAAVLGCPAAADELADIALKSRRECLEALARLQEMGLVTMAEDGATIRHGAVRLAVYRELETNLRSELHGLAADLLRASNRRHPPEAVARHYQLAGQRDRACRFAVEAARPGLRHKPGVRCTLLEVAYGVCEEAERNRVALPLAREQLLARRLASALRYGEVALRAGNTLSGLERLEARLVAVAAGEHLGQGTLDDTTRQLSRIRKELDRECPDARGDSLRAAVLDITAEAFLRANRREEATELARQAAILQNSPVPRARCLSLATQALLGTSAESAGSLQLAEKAVSAAREHDLGVELALALRRCVEALAEHGLLADDKGRGIVALSELEGASDADLGAHVFTLLTLADWHVATGSHALAQAAMKTAIPLTEGMDCPEIRARTQLAHARRALSAHNADAALRSLGAISGPPSDSPSGVRTKDRAVEGIAAPSRAVGPRLRGSIVGVWGHACLESGSVAQAMEAASQHPLADRLGGEPVELVLFHASLLARRAKVPEALELLNRAASGYARGRRLSWLRVALAISRLGRRGGAPDPGLAAEARGVAEEIGLPAFALRFAPFIDEDAPR
ncbi:MAG: AAA family ATPase [Gemmatimonadetes bacterium]|nr:AAA family ATPase [Gemmatimonadota bacterium]